MTHADIFKDPRVNYLINNIKQSSVSQSCAHRANITNVKRMKNVNSTFKQNPEAGICF